MPKARKKMFRDGKLTIFPMLLQHLGLFIHFSCICVSPKNGKIGTK